MQGHTNRFQKLMNHYHSGKTLFSYRDLVLNLVRRDITLRYIGSFAGLVWSLFNPLVIYITYYFIFTMIIPNNIDNFPLYLVVGIVHWVFFSQVVSGSCQWLIANGPLLKKIWFPRMVVPVSGILTILGFWISSLIVLFALYIPLGGRVGPALFAYPLLFALFFMFAFGIGLALSVFNAQYRDVGHLVDVILPLLFWFTPIIWSAEMVRHLPVWPLLVLNPVAPFINSFHAVLYLGEMPAPVDLVLVVIMAVAALALGLFMFRRMADDLVERL